MATAPTAEDARSKGDSQTARQADGPVRALTPRDVAADGTVVVGARCDKPGRGRAAERGHATCRRTAARDAPKGHKGAP